MWLWLCKGLAILWHLDRLGLWLKCVDQLTMREVR